MLPPNPAFHNIVVELWSFGLGVKILNKKVKY